MESECSRSTDDADRSREDTTYRVPAYLGSSSSSSSNVRDRRNATAAVLEDGGIQHLRVNCSANRLNHLLHRKEHLKRDGHADTAPPWPLAELPSLVGTSSSACPSHLHPQEGARPRLARFFPCRQAGKLSSFPFWSRKQEAEAIARAGTENPDGTCHGSPWQSMSVVSRGCLWLL